ncbi:DUF6215 domain-containing protein [Streptomyces sp. NPDC059398]|uniref:DUF6215 domain-containing protein n=1 Tax=Streptomyces sp. NPDC059398 TaxID=3346820 RepID=UPI0036CBC8F1
MDGHIDAPGAPGERANAWKQAIAALLLVGGLSVWFWVSWASSLSSSADADTGPKPATCGDAKPGEESGWHASGAQLCEALNRPDLAGLLGTREEIPKNAYGSDSSDKGADGKVTATPSAQVEFDTYTVNLTVAYDHLPVADSVGLLGSDAHQRRFLGRPAVLYSQTTISFRFRLDGSDTENLPGSPARVLSVAQDAKDSGGSIEIAVWRTDGWPPDDEVLLRVARKVLPAVRGWSAAV